MLRILHRNLWAVKAGARSGDGSVACSHHHRPIKSHRAITTTHLPSARMRLWQPLPRGFSSENLPATALVAGRLWFTAQMVMAEASLARPQLASLQDPPLRKWAVSTECSTEPFSSSPIQTVMQTSVRMIYGFSESGIGVGGQRKSCSCRVPLARRALDQVWTPSTPNPTFISATQAITYPDLLLQGNWRCLLGDV